MTAVPGGGLFVTYLHSLVFFVNAKYKCRVLCKLQMSVGLDVADVGSIQFCRQFVNVDSLSSPWDSRPGSPSAVPAALGLEPKHREELIEALALLFCWRPGARVRRAA